MEKKNIVFIALGIILLIVIIVTICYSQHNTNEKLNTNNNQVLSNVDEKNLYNKNFR